MADQWAVDSANSLAERRIQRKTNANLTGRHMKDGGVQGNTMWGSQTLKPPDKRFKEPQSRPQLNTSHSFKISKFGYFWILISNWGWQQHQAGKTSASILVENLLQMWTDMQRGERNQQKPERTTNMWRVVSSNLFISVLQKERRRRFKTPSSPVVSLKHQS